MSELQGKQGAGKTAEPLLNFEEIDRYKNLLLFAKSQVEGYFSGKHRSPYFGSNVEFADYKEYTLGEDTAHIDWRVYGRTKKLFLKQYEEETDMVAYLFVDASASMLFRGKGREPKYKQAAKIAAVLAYLMIRQSDKVSLALFAEKLEEFFPPSGTKRHLYTLLSVLEKIKPASTTAIAQALEEATTVLKKRGSIIVISDFLGDLERLFDVLGQFVHRKYEILLFHVVAPEELDLPSGEIARFIDMETGAHIEVEPEEIRRTYRTNMQRRIDEIRERANSNRMRHTLIETQNPYLTAIEAWLGHREQKRR